MKINPLTQIDFYKADHRRQYPEGTECVYSNFTPRSDKLFKGSKHWDKKIVFAGLQGFIKSFLIDTWNSEFFNKPKDEVVAKYKRRLDTSLGKGAVPVDHIDALHDLGFLPVEIRAIPEGSRVNIKVPVFTIVNTLPGFYWLTNYLETVLSAGAWKTSTNATIAYEYRRILKHYAEKTGSPLEFVALQGHDFSFRGMSGLYDAGSSGFGHLLSFVGTDTVPAIDYAEDYYNANSENELIGCSVPATEHSVMCAGGMDDEPETFRRLIEDQYPTGIVSIVSDTWDFWNVITNYTVQLKDKILARKPNELGLAKVVFRPDSGDPVKIICGYTYYEISSIEDDGSDDLATADVVKFNGKYYNFELTDDCYINLLSEVPEHEVKGAVECLWDVFGGTTTNTGHKVLHERVGLIYGDSITIERAEEIMSRLEKKGFASCNVVFGIGSYTYQYNTRDTFGFAMKATYAVVNGEGRELFKDPKTDSGTKKSAKGLLRVEKEGNDFVLYDQQDSFEGGDLDVVFRNGDMIKEQSLLEIRGRLLTS